MEFSANLGFLWNELTLPQAIKAAKQAGFDAVECHWPYDIDPDEVRKALEQSGLKMLGLNTIKGPKKGDMGLAARPHRVEEARHAIDQAIDYAQKIGTQFIHVMAGTRSQNSFDDCKHSFVSNLQYACARAEKFDQTILIEPLNPYDNPDYFLMDLELAVEIVDMVSENNLKIMFDCYHLQIRGGDLLRRFRQVQPLVGHVQIAGVPLRDSPANGEVAYERLLPAILDAGYEGAFGAEFRPNEGMAAFLDWMQKMKANDGAFT